MTAAVHRSWARLPRWPVMAAIWEVHIIVFLFHFTGRLLDATKNYMYVFLLAGCEVVLSALVLFICNFLFIKMKPQEPDPPAKMEMAITETEMEELNKSPKDDQDNGGGASENGKKAGEPEATPKSDDKKVVELDSIELENASKAVTEPNGVVVEPESSL